MNAAGYDNLYIPATGPWSSGMADYNAEWTNEMYEAQNMDKAKELVQEAGIPDRTVKIVYGGSSAEEAMTQVLQANLAELGITAEITSVDAGVFWSSMGDPTGWDLSLMSCSAPSGYGLDSMTAFLTGLNFQGWSGEKFDQLKELCNSGAMAENDDERMEKTKELWDLIEEEVPIYGMVYLTNTCAFDSRLENFQIADQFSFCVKDLSFAD